jgi:DNA-binding NarL/FixJ family response regulator
MPALTPRRTSHRKRDGALTPRQRQILHLITEGMTNRQIAHEFDISVRTVEVHRFNLMRRLRVRNVAQLFKVALTAGLVGKKRLSRPIHVRA